jgi:hypothetical protein
MDTPTPVTLKAAGLPGGGACAYSQAGTCQPGQRVLVSSQAKGTRPSTLGTCLGTLAHPFLGAIDLWTYKADK